MSRGDVVLVVEDTPASLGLLNETLEEAGFTVLLAGDGERALEILRRVTPNAILMDALLPGESGFETTRRIRRRERLADVPIIFMTGLSDTAHVIEGLEAGGVDYVTKPIDPAELVARLHVHVLNARAARDSRAALDVSGQHVVAVDSRGIVRWSTPRALAILFPEGAAHDIDGDGAGTTSAAPRRLPDDVVLWLADSSASEPSSSSNTRPDDLQIVVGGRPLALVHVGRAGRDEHLVRVLDGAPPDSRALLREAYALTEREAETLGWLVNGKSNKEIAEILAISPRTVNKHLDNVFVKLGVENRTAAAIVAIRRIVGEAYRSLV